MLDKPVKVVYDGGTMRDERLVETVWVRITPSLREWAEGKIDHEASSLSAVLRRCAEEARAREQGDANVDRDGAV
jgi:hypothetical protein